MSINAFDYCLIFEGIQVAIQTNSTNMGNAKVYKKKHQRYGTKSTGV